MEKTVNTKYTIRSPKKPGEEDKKPFPKIHSQKYVSFFPMVPLIFEIATWCSHVMVPLYTHCLSFLEF